MTPSLNVRRSVSPGAITNGKINDLQSQLGRAKDQVIVAERIEIPEICPVGNNHLVFVFPEDLGSAECILYRLSQQLGKGHAEELVA